MAFDGTNADNKVISNILIALGFFIIYRAWKVLHAAQKKGRLATSGPYAVVRHPQYLGGILAIFVATLLLYPHWLFAVLGVLGAIILYWSTGYEERRLIQQFGSEYQAYMQRVPRMDLILGIVRSFRRQKSR